MNCQLAGLDILLDAGLLNESFGQGILFPMSDHPSNDISAEYVHDDIKIKVGPFHWAFELGDIPGPNLIGSGGKQFGFFVMAPLMSPSSLFDITVLRGEDPVHGPDGTMILPLIQKCGINLVGRLILESF
jgi:hypothetical protein